MSFKMIGDAFNVPLKANDKLVFLVLCEYANDATRSCYPSYKTIQTKASMANSTLKTSLMILESIGLITISIRSTKKGGRTSTLYKISEFEKLKFDLDNYKKIASKIRFKRNAREKNASQPPKIDLDESCSNLQKSIEGPIDAQILEFNEVYDSQTPKVVEKPLDSSNKSLALLEEDESIKDDFVLPAELSNIPVWILAEAIDKAVSKLAKKSPVGYRKKMIKGLINGDPGWISTVLEFVRQVEAVSEAPWERRKRLHSQELQNELEKAGFDNLLDFLESID